MPHLFLSPGLGAVYASLAGSLYTHYMTLLSPSSFDLFWSIGFGERAEKSLRRPLR
jgi:hypothetical protein